MPRRSFKYDTKKFSTKSADFVANLVDSRCDAIKNVDTILEETTLDLSREIEKLPENKKKEALKFMSKLERTVKDSMTEDLTDWLNKLYGESIIKGKGIGEIKIETDDGYVLVNTEVCSVEPFKY